MAKAKVIMYGTCIGEFVTTIYNGVTKSFVPKIKDKEIISIDDLIPISGPFLLYAQANTSEKARTNLVKEINNYEQNYVDALAIGGNRFLIHEAHIQVFQSPYVRPHLPILPHYEYCALIAAQEYKFIG